MKLSVVLPCYNEEENIASIPEILMPELQKLGCEYEIILVDDGSTDKGVETARALGIPQLRIVRHEKNMGLGAAVKTGIKNANGELLVILDSDFTFHPRYIRDLLARFVKGDVDFVIGSPRLASFGKDIQKYRVFVSIAANMAYSVLLGRRVTAVSPIFRLYKTAQLKELPLETNGFDISVEILFRLILVGRTFAEVPTPLGVRQFGQSKLNYRKELIRHLKLVRKIISWRLQSLFVRRSSRNTRHWPHWTAIGFALCIGGIYFLPNILIPALQAPAGFGVYHPLSLEAPTLDEVGAYGGRLREVMDGHFADGDAYIAEYKNRPTLWGSNFLAVVLGVIPFFLRMKDPTPIYVFGDFVFPAVTFLVVYGLFFMLTRHRIWSALSAIIFLVFPNFSVYRTFLNPSFYANTSVLKVFELLERGFSHFLSRLFVPGFSLIFFVLFLLAATRLFLKEKPSFKAVAFAAAAFGALFYVYFYYWVFATVFLSIVSALYFLTRDRARAVSALSAFALGAVLAIPYVAKTLFFRQGQFYAEISQRVGLEISRVFQMSSLDLFILLALLAATGWFLGKKRGVKQIGVVFTALFLSVVIVVNLQVFTGFNIQSDHWSSRVIVYITTFVLMSTAYWALDFLLNAFGKPRGRRRLFELLAMVAVIFFLTLGLVIEVMSAMIMANEYKIPQDDLIAWHWINRNLPRDAVFVSPSSKATFYIPFFTHGNVYTPPSCYSVAPNDEIMDRFLDVSAYFGVPKDFLRRLFLVNVNGSGLPPGTGRNLRPIHFELDPVYMLFCATFIDFKPAADLPPKESLRPFSMDDLTDIMIRYERRLTAVDHHRFTLPFRADYVFWGPHERLISSVSPKQYENLRLIFSHNLVEIYEILP